MANKPEPPAPWIVIGVVLTALGAALLTVDDATVVLAGAVMVVIGGFAAQIAVIAAGVSWGMRRHENLRGR